MKFLCLIYTDEHERDAIPAEEWEPLMQQGFADAEELGDVFLGGQALQPVRTAVTLRRKRGERSFTDGPFAETKEQLAGFYLIEARDLNDAIQVASKIPPAREGSIEVRPVRELNP
jgi:hypothetical protein